ncbi:hypothetical protein [Robinsoniella peoriensis]|uniref:hypothetical protein n=1 Tax=Robinsoniella peoriensis TaxID=180332 RepID=UPI00085CA071|nr:hypothetical protein [Robinsoniella peoriensis]
MNKYNSLRMEVVRCFGSLRFWGCIALVLLSCCLYLAGSWTSVVQNIYGVHSVITILNQMINFDRFKSLTLLAAAFVYSGSFCDDRKDNYLCFICTRTTLKKYVFNKVIINGVGVFTAIIVGIIAFSLILSIFIPYYIPGELNIIEYRGIVGCIFYMVLPFAFGSIFLTTLGLLFSTIVLDKMIVYAIPFLCNYVFSSLTYNIGSEGMLFVGLMSSDILVLEEFKFLNLLLKIFIFLFLSGLLSITFYMKLKRSMENDNYK